MQQKGSPKFLLVNDTRHDNKKKQKKLIYITITKFCLPTRSMRDPIFKYVWESKFGFKNLNNNSFILLSLTG